MKKTLTVNISGVVFHIDEDAYDKLNRYLGRIRQSFASDEGCDEILSGIEGRIAEMFQEKVRDHHRQVVTLEDVKEVIGQLGEPEQISGEETREKEAPHTGSFAERGPRRLYRDPDDKYIGGVCGGLGAFFDIDPTWMRIIFLIGIFAGFGIILYLILWIVIPRARTTAEKLEMRGEKVNLSNIERSIKEDIQDIKRNLKDLSEETRDVFKKKSPDRPDSALRSVARAIAAVFTVLFRIVAAIIGLVIIVVGFALLVALLTALFFGPHPIVSGYGPWLFSFPHFFSLIFASAWVGHLATAALVLTVGIPLVALMYAGLNLIFNFKGRTRGIGAFMFFLWIVGLSLSIGVSIHAAREFTAQRTLRTEHRFEPTASDTIYVKLSRQPGHYETVVEIPSGMFGIWDTSQIGADGRILGVPRLRIREHAGEDFHITITKESRGGSYFLATKRSEQIDYGYLQQDSLLLLDPYFSFDSSDGWRVQKVHLELFVPEGKVLEVGQDLRRWML
jgi:phage shock protein PspC (stress-responsive transcriptional regulator)